MHVGSPPVEGLTIITKANGDVQAIARSAVKHRRRGDDTSLFYMWDEALIGMNVIFGGVTKFQDRICLLRGLTADGMVSAGILFGRLHNLPAEFISIPGFAIEFDSYYPIVTMTWCSPESGWMVIYKSSRT
jgi:hypothetical protein